MSEMVYMYWAKRLQLEIPTLCAIEKDCVQNIEYIRDVVDEFYKDHPMYEDIKRFVESIYYTGQRIEDWDINFFKFEEAVDENGNLVENEKKREEILIKKALQWAKRRQESLDRYKNTREKIKEKIGKKKLKNKNKS